MLRSALARQLSQARAGLAAPQQQLRGFAEQAVAVALKEPDWDAFYALVSSDEGKREVGSLRSAFNETKKQLEKMGTGPKDVDWSKFKDVDKPVLDLFRKSFANLKIPKYDPSAHIKQVETEFEPLLKSASELEAFSTKREAEIRAEIKTIDDEIESLNKRTIEDELKSDPQLQKEVDEDISKGNYY